MKRYLVLPVCTYIVVMGFLVWKLLMYVMETTASFGDGFWIFSLGLAALCVVSVPVAWVAGPVVALVSIVVVGVINMTSTAIRRFRA
ncbi:hypothetical protein NLN82_20855 [Citrobacter portucalensis]|uniref:hypothetical protein n=1 Tax=Citrobacter portucalensis TaxID=1639133 RepID=UPI00226B8CC5|nr:hypothetical protein [Citrobacter portucalensis]MCX9038480.1 hypothetical protein [Citrobacter portucalensis]